MTVQDQEKIASVQEQAEAWSPEQLLAWAATEFGSVAIASSFGVEDMALIDFASRNPQPIAVFTLDTAFLFPETYKLIEATEKKYGIKVERMNPALTPEAQAQQHGEALWTRDPNQCCGIRKIEPLKRKLGTLQAWITGIRREQSPTRANARKIEWDNGFGLVKINPLADWTNKQVWKYIFDKQVPYNPLHDLNYPSIGCTHCTRQVGAGEDERAGRWAGFAKTECGLHSGN
jgi:phosphoadenosine phosphosulfate reductase